MPENETLQRSTGTWKFSRKTRADNIVTCSICSYEYYLGEYCQYSRNYCPRCGSKMEG